MHILAFLLLMLLTINPAYAGNTPLPPQKTHSLEILKEKLAAEEARQEQLARQAKEAEKDITNTKSIMVDLSAQIRKNESGLRSLEERVQELTRQEQDLKTRLDSDHGSIAKTILGLERIRRIPPELMIVRPGAPLETAQTALLLQNLLPALDHRAEKLSQDIKNLRDVQTELARDQKELTETKNKLDQQQAELGRLMEARQKEFKSANAAYRSSAARAEQFAAEARSLNELVARIEEDNRTIEESESPAPRKKTRSFRMGKAPGKGIWPVSGKAMAKFGEYDGMGAEIQGIKIKAASKAIVVTPLEGTIKYSGTFRNYGELVIVEHSAGYHSLIAGLSRANVAIGQSVKAGEPLGYMPSSSSQEGLLTLYYELRHNGEPVDPSYLFADLKS